MVYRANAMICTCTNCISNGALRIKDALETEISNRGLENDVQIVPTGASGLCVKGPILIVHPEGIFYQLLKVEDIPHLVEEHFLKGRPVESFMYVPPLEEAPIPKICDIPFFKNQRLIALRNRGLIDPEKIDEYIARDGYKALAKALTSMTPEQIIKEVKDSGIRGRGGAGFPTGLKWEFCRKSEGEPKYVICNADEGDPGAFMDRSIIEADPHSILEGMAIGAYAIGASKSYIYVRIEYPLAIERMKVAVKQAREYGLLGEDILGSGFDFDVEMFKGAGAFVCGEETSLIASIEGRSPEPRTRPPFPAQSGVWGKPTNINNVETWANVPVIINWGAKWFSEIGTEKSKGTKVFSLAGNINNAGLVEVPMGITLREMIYDIGGGIPNNKRFKAVQTGGPSGGCIPEKLLDLPIDYERLAEVGSIMGSGGMIVMDENTCMVDIARYFLEFVKSESCGKCTACREGTDVIYRMLVNICEGNGKEGDIEILEELSQAVKDGALCALGGTAPNSFLSTIRYFREEYEAHIKYKRCPAVVCKKIISSPCKYSCPLNQDAPAYISLIAKRQFDEALEVIRKTNPLPVVCGRVCHRLCEKKCRSGEWGDPIAIRSLKRFAADYEFQAGITPTIKPPEQQFEKVAIIGSGPAGLTCGYFLAQRGYKPTIFEALPVAGGMLAVGIPEYRLPKKLLQREIEFIQKSGVTIKTDSKVENIDELFAQGYKAIFIATGAHKSRKLGIPGEDMQGVLDPIEFLREVNLGQETKIDKKVGIIGGGNVAIDVARTALRLGAEKVLILYRRTREEMPAAGEEVDGALGDGVEIEFLVTPKKVLSRNGKMTGLECVRNELGDMDASGRRRPVPVEGSEFEVELDTLLPAITQQPDLSFLPGTNGLEITKADTIAVDSETMLTSKEGVFAGGDVVAGPATVTEAMSQGKVAAESIHKYLRGKSLEREYDVLRPSVDVEPLKLTDEEAEELETITRPKMPEAEVSQRVKSFEEVELGFAEEMAVTEAKRCLRCDL